MTLRIVIALILTLLAVRSASASDGFIGIPPDVAGGKKLDTEQLTVGGNTVQRQRIQITGQGATDILPISATAGARVNLRNSSGTEIGTTSDPLRGLGVDTIPSSETTFDGAGDEACVNLAGQQEASFYLNSGTLTGSFTIRFTVNGTTYTSDGQDMTAVFIHPRSGVTATGFSVTNPNDALSRGVWVPVPAQTVCVRLSSHTSGSATGRVIATAQRTMVMLAGTDGGTPRVPVVTNTTPASNDYAIAVRCIGCPGGTGGTAVNDNTTFTGGSTSGTPAFALYDNTPPAVTDGNAGIVRMTAQRDLRAAVVTVNGASPWDETNQALFVVPKTVITPGGQNGPTSVAAVTNGTTQFNKSLTGATPPEVLEIVAVAPSGQFARITNMIVVLNESTGSANFSIVQGSGTNCADNQETVFGPYRLSATENIGFVLPPGPTEWVKTTTAARGLCARIDATVDVQVSGRSATY